MDVMIDNMLNDYLFYFRYLSVHKANNIEMMNTLTYDSYDTRNVSEISKVDTITMEPY